jgi:alpha-1,3-glucan synthase
LVCPLQDEAISLGSGFALVVVSAAGFLRLPPRPVLTVILFDSFAVAFFLIGLPSLHGPFTEVWVLRACIVQGLQQIWVSALWYWGAQLTGKDPDDYVSPRFLMYVVWPLAVMSLAFAYLMFWGLPDYYRQVSDCGFATV